MNRFPFNVLLFVLLGATACSFHRKDEEIENDIQKELQGDANASEVKAIVNDGIVYLSGSCDGDDCASEIVTRMKNVEGVDSVNNKVVAQNSTDLTLRTSVLSVIDKYPGVQADVASGVIVLRGIIAKTHIQALMDELSALRPKKIDNQLVVN